MQTLTNEQADSAIANAFAPTVPTVSRTTKRATVSALKRISAKRAKLNAKPATKPAKRASGKPASEQPTKANAARAARVAVLSDARDLARRYYAGASIAAHKSVAASRTDYIARACDPVQRANSVSVRDESGLALILANSKAGTFDPCAFALDLGILSRLASQHLVTYTGSSDSFALTARGVTLARAIVKRAA